MSGENVRADDGEVSCVAITVAKHDYIDDVRRALEDLIEPVRKERGVIQYQMYRDYADARRFVFIERWQSLDAFEAHCVAPHIRDYLERTRDWLEQSAFHVLEKVR